MFTSYSALQSLWLFAAVKLYSSTTCGAQLQEHFIFFRCACFMMKALQKPHTIRKQLSSSNLFMSDMLFLMKALAALHNQLAISELIFHPAIVMSSPGTGIIHNSLCYDKLRPRAREVYERFWAHVKSMPFVLE